MSNALDKLIERLPRHFALEEHSNNYKLLSIIAEQSNQNRAIMSTILRFWDADQAEGIGLDRLGKDEGVLRGGMSDEEYRKMIKIQCILNMSDGDIPTINLILDAFIGENFIGVSDGFRKPFFQPATIIGHVKSGAKLPNKELLKRIKPAGVGFRWLHETLGSRIVLDSFKSSFPVRLPICGTFYCDGIPGTKQDTTIEMQSEQYYYPVSLPITGEIYPNEVINEW